MSEPKEKGKLAIFTAAAIAILGVKGGALLMKGGSHGVDDAAKGAAHLAPMADDAAKGAAVASHGVTDTAHIADEAANAAASWGEHGSGLVYDGGKFIKRTPTKGMSDAERIARSANDVARSEARRRRTTEEEDEKKDKR